MIFDQLATLLVQHTILYVLLLSMHDYLVKWGNFNILNIKLQGLGNKLKKKKTLGIRMFLLFYSSTPRNQVRLFMCQNWCIEFADEML